MLRLMRPGPGWGLVTSLLVAAAASCAKARPDVIGTPRCVSWKQEIAPLLATQCGSCHGGAAPAGKYATSSYAGVLAGGSDAVPNAKAGDANSLLLSAIDPLTADVTHQPLSAAAPDLFPTVRSWVVDCNLSYVRSSIHRGGILDPASVDFHGQLLRDQKYAFGGCQKCHGTDFAGGTSGVSCLTCHAEGPTACSTCHGDIKLSGSHGWHLGGGPLGKTYDCSACHRVPTTYTDVGHILLADGSLDPAPAEVTLGPAAAQTPVGETRAAPPTFDPVTKSCSNVYCHGAILGDSAAINTHPRWNAAGTGQADCGTCHGLPPNHTGIAGGIITATTAACVACHPSVVDKNQRIIAPDKHIDGQIELGDPAAGCGACHGGPSSPAPPPGLTGATATSALGVGAHQAHLLGSAHLRGPVACGECHRVPTEVSSPGHFSGHAAGDTDTVIGAEVFPADPAVGALASSGGGAPRWDRVTATCAGVYCHGGGSKLGTDTTVGLDRAPVWTAGGGLVCGVACHGLPPTTSPHVPTLTRFDCVTCHPRTIDPSGTIIVSGPLGAETSLHINGVVDVAQ